MTLFFADTVWAQPNEGADTAHESPRASGYLQPDPQRVANETAAASAFSTDEGYLFLNGQYVAPPYQVTLKDELIEINGVGYDESAFDFSELKEQAMKRAGESRRPRRGASGLADGQRGRGFGSNRAMGRRGGGFRGGSDRAASSLSPAAMTMRRFYRDLEGLKLGCLCILRDRSMPVVIWPEHQGSTLLETLLVQQGERPETPEIVPGVDLAGQHATYSHLVASFRTTPDFTARVSDDLKDLLESGRRNQGQITANWLSHYAAYPLTMLALILVVLSAGHLMGNAQATFSITDPSGGGIDFSKNIVQSLIILALMSSIDLIWTVLAQQSGSFRELNPLGSRLINDPQMLIVFKIAITGMSIGLLYHLRHLPFTRKATWWCCLTLTLLTARWLTFHSMLI